MLLLAALCGAAALMHLAIHPGAVFLPLKTWAGAIIFISLAGTGALVWLVFFRILRGIRHLNHELGGKSGSGDELTSLARRVRRINESMQMARAELEESHETLRHTEKMALTGKLAAGVAHSIRNPLTGVKMRLFSLRKGLELNDRQQEDFAAIHDAIKHMEGIISNFLAFSRRPKLSMAPASITEIVDNTLTLIKPRLEAFRVEVKLHRADVIPIALADAEQIREALVNLIINACEAMDGGGTITITEEAGQLAPLGRVVVVRIADTGPGIPQEMLDAVFQPFVSTKPEGTGLGLPIAKRIFEEHGGWLHAHVLPGRGTTFAAVLPAQKDDYVWVRS